ncbi:hypothetical protein A0257_19605 [Hymenobacter psoromatis]|nr:hypothetical protein A0257_19605 [Hymenobacter psoromatis]
MLIFGFQVLEPHQLADLQTRIFRFLRVKHGLADAVLPHNLGDGLTALLLLENGDNLGVTESTLFHKDKLEVRKLRLSPLSTGLLAGEAYTSAFFMASVCGFKILVSARLFLLLAWSSFIAGGQSRSAYPQ